jgi:uncharacterized protein
VFNNSIYTIPYQEKVIIYQPLNKFAFIGNRAIVNLIKDVFSNKKVVGEKNEEALSFLNAHGLFNQYNLESSHKSSQGYKPSVAVLCMTSACNFRCSYCFACGGETEPAELPFETGKMAIDIAYNHAKEMQADQYMVSFHGGGEPALPFKKLQDFTAYARGKDLHCRVELTSNGYWDDEKTEWIISNIDNLTLSFDGIGEVQNSQRPLANGKETFDVVMKTINKLDDSRLRYGIRITVTNSSVKRLEESIAFLCSHTKCPTFQVEPAFGAGRALTNHQTIENNNLFVEHFLRAYDIAFANQRHMYYSGARPWVNTNCFCTAHDNALVVTPNGILSSCYEISGSDHPLAKAFHFGEMSPEGDINIDFTKRETFQNKIQERRDLCKHCFCYWHCAGDCPAKTMLPDSFDNNTFSARCDVNREITKELLIRYLITNEGIYKGL